MPPGNIGLISSRHGCPPETEFFPNSAATEMKPDALRDKLLPIIELTVPRHFSRYFPASESRNTMPGLVIRYSGP